MTVLRHYVMVATEGRETEMADALRELAGKVSPLDGCEGVEILRDPRQTTYFVFIERWASIDAHKACGRLLGKEALDPVLAAIAQPPEGRYLEPIAAD